MSGEEAVSVGFGGSLRLIWFLGVGRNRWRSDISHDKTRAEYRNGELHSRDDCCDGALNEWRNTRVNWNEKRSVFV